MMKTDLKCIQCLVRNTINAAEMLTDDPAVREDIVRTMTREIAEYDYQLPPTAMSRRIYTYASRKTGVDDPYREQKDKSTRIA